MIMCLNILFVKLKRRTESLVKDEEITMFTTRQYWPEEESLCVGE